MGKLMNIVFRVSVSGESCWPELMSGQSYWASSLLRPRVGKFVVFKREKQHIVKKIQRIEGDTLYVGGTVSWSSSFVLSRGAVLGRVLFR